MVKQFHDLSVYLVSFYPYEISMYENIPPQKKILISSHMISLLSGMLLKQCGPSCDT